MPKLGGLSRGFVPLFAAILVLPFSFLAPRSGQAQAVRVASSGSIVVARAEDFYSFDPAYVGDLEGIRVANELFSGLLGISPSNALYPDLATAMPTVSNGGRVYTFQLRRGLRFADGTPLTASDVAFSINRSADPNTQNWAVGELSTVKGYAAVEAGKAKTLSGVQVVDPLTIRFNLSQPDAIFPYKMSMANFFIVDPRQVKRYGKNFGKHPLGSGPFKFVSWTPGQRVVVVRNPYYYRKDANGVQLPYLDKITWLVNVNDDVAVLKLERGEVDVLADGVPKESYAAVAADPRFSKLIVREPAPYTYQVGFNVAMKPFTDLRVRQAVAMAIDRPRLIKLIGKTRVFLSTQRYPKGFEAWDPSYKPLPFDPARAKALLAKAGYPHGFSTTYLVGNWPDSADAVVGQALQQDLAAIGIKLTIRSANSQTASDLTNKPRTIPLFTQWWGPDFPEATDFILAQFTCGQEAPHGSNNLYYCDHHADALLAQAQATLDHTKRIALERQLQRVILDDVSVFPLFQTYWVTIRPVRLANFYIHPIWTWDYAYYCPK
jgi:ABC-type transport system substrate-binding protein